MNAEQQTRFQRHGKGWGSVGTLIAYQLKNESNGSHVCILLKHCTKFGENCRARFGEVSNTIFVARAPLSVPSHQPPALTALFPVVGAFVEHFPLTNLFFESAGGGCDVPSQYHGLVSVS